MPADAFLKGMNAIHRVILFVSRGRAGWQVGPMPVVELTTTGRKSGQQRTVLLTSPIQENGSIVLVASRGGDDHHPAWYLNLCANPRVQASDSVRDDEAGPGVWLLRPQTGAAVHQWAVWRRQGGIWRFDTQPAAETGLRAEGADLIVVSAVGRQGHESARRWIRPAAGTPAG